MEDVFGKLVQNLKTQVLYTLLDAWMLPEIECICCDWPHIPTGKLGIGKLPIQQMCQEQRDITWESYTDRGDASIPDRQKVDNTPKTCPLPADPALESRQKEAGACRPRPSLLRAAEKDNGISGSEPEHLVFHVISLKIF